MEDFKVVRPATGGRAGPAEAGLQGIMCMEVRGATRAAAEPRTVLPVGRRTLAIWANVGGIMGIRRRNFAFGQAD